MNIKRALITVYDKSGIENLASYLARKGVEIISTEGTYDYLKSKGIRVKSIKEYSPDESLLGGRIKTISPKLVGGILADRSNNEHMQEMYQKNIPEIDMLIVNFCPFREFSENIYDEYELVQKIDIGGINLVRSAAKNYRSVLPIVDPDDYQKIISNFELCGDVPLQNRRRYALKAFYNTMRYEESIHSALSFLFAEEKYEHMTFERLNEFKYGENPHQYAYLSKITDEKSLFEKMTFIEKKRLTFRLYKQMYSGLDFMRHITSKAFTILINFLPVYFSLTENDKDYMESFEDELIRNSNGNSAFISKGSVNSDTARYIKRTGIKVVLAKSYEEEALKILKDADLTILATFDEFRTSDYERYFLDNEMIVQQNDQFENFGILEKIYAPANSDIEYSSDLLCISQILKSLKTCSLVRIQNGKMYGMASGTLSDQECFALCEKRFERSIKVIKGGTLGFDVFPSLETIEKAKRKWGIDTLLIPDSNRLNEKFLDSIKSNNITLYTFTKRHYK